jgi:acetyl-CoA C-acetyltransferase
LKNSNDIVIVSAARTPIGKFGEAFKSLRAHELAATVITEVLKRANLSGNQLDDVILGDCCQCAD